MEEVNASKRARTTTRSAFTRAINSAKRALNTQTLSKTVETWAL